MRRNITSDRTGRLRRWVARGFGIAASAILAGGCQSVDPNQDTAAPFSPSIVRVMPLLPTSSSHVIQAVAEEKDNPSSAPGVQTAEAESTIDLAAALQLGGMDNPKINLVREVVREAVARQQAAQVLLLPNLTIGGNVRVHRGVLQSSTGIIRNVDSQDLYVGAGALAAATVGRPGIRLFSHLGDAIFEPLAARQRVESSRSVSAATENQILLQVATAYFDLLGAEVRLEALRKSETDLAEVVRLTVAYAKRGQGRIGDAHRAEANANLLHRQSQEAEGNVTAASARLAGLLSLDPAVRLQTPGGAIQPVNLIDENETLEALIGRGLLNRPEVRARLQELAEARTRVRQEKIRPLLPTVSIGYSAGTFGGGSNLTAAGIAQPGGGVSISSSLGRFDGRSDFDVFAVWTLQNAGVGNRALAGRLDAVAGRAVVELERTNNEIRREIAEALADAQAGSRRIEVTRAQLALAGEGFREEMARIKQDVSRPLEVLDSFRQLLDARQDILAATIAYNAAQYRLFVAVGYSPLQSSGACRER